jgi:hypothetical protein
VTRTVGMGTVSDVSGTSNGISTVAPGTGNHTGIGQSAKPYAVPHLSRAA